MTINTACDIIQSKLLRIHKPHSAAGQIPTAGQAGLKDIERSESHMLITFGELKRKHGTELQIGKED